MSSWSAKTSLLLAIVLAVAWGYGQNTRAEEQTVVRFSYWANYHENQFILKVCEGFERQNPGISIKREWYVGDYGRKLQLVVLTDKAADIILMDDDLFPMYCMRGYLEDLRPYVERKSDDTERMLASELGYIETPERERDPAYQRRLFPTSLESFSYRGVQGGLPWDGSVCVVFYNKQIFDDAGMPYPREDWTWDEFREIAKKLTRDIDGDGRIDQFGMNMGFDLLSCEPVFWSYGADILDPGQMRCVIDSPRGREAMQFLYDVKFTDHSSAWVGEMEGLFAEAQLLTGRLGLAPAMSYLIPMLNRVKEGDRWGVAHMPIGPYGDRFTRVTWDGISINSRTSPHKKEIAWKFIKYLIGEESQSILGDMQRGIPVLREAALTHYVQADTSAREEVAIEAIDQYSKLTPVTPRFMEIRDLIRAEMDRLAFADTTGARPAETLSRIQRKINNVLAREAAQWTTHPSRHRTARHAGASGVRVLGAALGTLTAAIVLLLSFRPVRRRLHAQLEEIRCMVRSRKARTEGIEGILFASPWLVGLFVFTAFPILFSIVLSVSEWNPYEPLSKLRFVGLDNFTRAFSQDEVFGDPLMLKSLYNTFYFAIFSVPLTLCVSLGLALLLNQKIRGITVFRTTFYLPSIVSGVATVILWYYIFNPAFGPLNAFLHALNHFFDQTRVLAFIDLPEPNWLLEARWSKPALIIMAMWGAGGAGMLVFLAGLQGVPDQLYEVAELDGAGRLQKFLNITLPMLTPTIYFNLIMGIIGSMKVFMSAYVLTNGTGGADKSLLFYVLHLYTKAFVDQEMGYASALAWILFVIILMLTLLVIRSSTAWVYYESEEKR